MEIDARELNLPGTGWLKETGEATVGIAGLCEADDPPGRNGVENGKPCGPLLAADDVGNGGENGKGENWFEACRLMLEATGDTDG